MFVTKCFQLAEGIATGQSIKMGQALMEKSA
jgi:hypothetical protein